MCENNNLKKEIRQGKGCVHEWVKKSKNKEIGEGRGCVHV